jgi:hypothetical protein
MLKAMDQRPNVEGQMSKAEGQRKKAEGQRKKAEGRKEHEEKEERKILENDIFSSFLK